PGRPKPTWHQEIHMYRPTRTARLFLLAASLAWATGAAAQMPPGIGAQPAQLGGATPALRAKCGHYPDAELEQLRKEQRAQHQATGLDMTAFDADFEQAYKEAEARWASASEAERRDTCARIAR